MTEALCLVLGGLLVSVPAYLDRRALRDENRRLLTLLLARTPIEAAQQAAVLRVAGAIAPLPTPEPVRRPVQLD